MLTTKHSFLFALFFGMLFSTLYSRGEDQHQLATAYTNSKNGYFSVKAGPLLKEAIPVNQLHKWVITVLDDQHKVVYPARIAINGGMPAHGHGLPTQPQVTKYLGEGQYLIEGMQFNMDGQWLLRLEIVSETRQDTVDIDVNVSY